VPISQGFAIGTQVLAVHKWNAFSIAEDVELYVRLTEQGVRIESAPKARVYSEEARSLRQSATQRHRWAAGKLTVLWRCGGPLLRSRAIGLHQKLDVMGELASTAPALHLGLVALLAPALYFTRAPAATWVVVALVASLLRPAVYALIALVHDPEPGRAALAFSFLPFYTLWRLGTQVVALKMLGDKTWVRTERNAPTNTGGEV
jgi:cellulose synthase/poly-beta-1,6-N-acetylglucosamine synthase-like glycosyltransferase